MHAAKVAAVAALLLAATASARVLLQVNMPARCDDSSGSWDSDDINCDFTCGSSGWEIDCEAGNDDVECKVDQDGAPDSADVRFTCPLPPTGQAPDCSGQLSGFEALNDQCVMSAVNEVLAAWRVSPDDDNDDNDRRSRV